MISSNNILKYVLQYDQFLEWTLFFNLKNVFPFKLTFVGTLIIKDIDLLTI